MQLELPNRKMQASQSATSNTEPNYTSIRNVTNFGEAFPHGGLSTSSVAQPRSRPPPGSGARLDGLRLALELLHGFNVCVRRERQCGHRAQHARRRARVREERVLTDRGRWVEGSYLEVVVERAVTYREDESVGAAKGAARVAAGERVPRLVVPAHDAWQHEDPAERVRECEGRADLTKLEVDQLNVARGAHAAGRVEEPFRHVRRARVLERRVDRVGHLAAPLRELRDKVVVPTGEKRDGEDAADELLLVRPEEA
eukprot:6196158-Pleurochrysis_carterae.AAC.1